jgi:hypothetical protein
MASLSELEALAALYVRYKASGDESLSELYYINLRQAQPSQDERDYIDRRVAELISRSTSYPRTALILNRSLLPPGEVDVDSVLALPAVARDLFEYTPLGRMNSLVSTIGEEWSRDPRDLRKAYVCAVCCELAYLHVTEKERVAPRFRLFKDSLINAHLRHRHVDIRSVLGAFEFEAYTIATPYFVYLIMNMRRFILVAVRGTATRADWWINANVGLSGPFHRGFDHEARAVRPKLEALIAEKFGRRALPLYFTGHSLGGAVAAISALQWSGPEAMMTPYTFGAPRFARGRRHASSSYAYVLPSDLVPHAPPRFLRFADNRLCETIPPNQEPKSGLSALRSWIVHRRHALDFHLIEYYRRPLGREIFDVDFLEDIYIRTLPQTISL